MIDHIPDLTKMIGETPRTDAAYFKPHATMYDLAGEMKLMERELNAANERIKRLEESENRMLNWLTEDCPEAVKKQLSNAWMKSKEAKP